MPQSNLVSLRRPQAPHGSPFLPSRGGRGWLNPATLSFQADEIVRARRAGASGLKVLKVLGLALREKVTEGPLIAIDDRRFDPMWEAAGGLDMPVVIHTSDPAAFFLPVDRINERFEELHVHPEWSFFGDFPSNRALHEAATG